MRVVTYSFLLYFVRDLFCFSVNAAASFELRYDKNLSVGKVRVVNKAILVLGFYRER